MNTPDTNAATYSPMESNMKSETYSNDPTGFDVEQYLENDPQPEITPTQIERQRISEVDELLAKSGVSRADVAGQGSDVVIDSPPASIQSTSSSDEYVCTNANCHEFGAVYPACLTDDLNCARCGQPMIAKDSSAYYAAPAVPIAQNFDSAKAEPPPAPAYIPPDQEAQAALTQFETPADSTVKRIELTSRLSSVLDELGQKLEIAKQTSEVPEFPADVVKKLVASKITKPDVENILSVFERHVSIDAIRQRARSIVVTDPSQKDLMKKAKEFRLIIKQARLRLCDLIELDTDEHRRKHQVYTGVKKIVTDLFREEEDYLQFQEETETRRAEEQRNDLRIKRFNELTRLEFGNIDGLMDLAEYEDTAWDAIRAAAEAAFNAKQAEAARLEQERVERENKARIATERVKTLSEIGLIYSREHRRYQYGNVSIADSMIELGTAEEFEYAVADIKPKIESIKTEQQRQEQLKHRTHEREKQLLNVGFRMVPAGTGMVAKYMFETFDHEPFRRDGCNEVFLQTALDEDWSQFIADAEKYASEIHAHREKVAAAAQQKAIRHAQVTSLGMTPDPDGTEKYIYPGTLIEVMAGDRDELDDDAWTVKLKAASDAVASIKAEAQRQADGDAEAHRQELLGDKERISEWGQMIQAEVLLRPPAVHDPAAAAIVGEFITDLDTILRRMQTGMEGLA